MSDCVWVYVTAKDEAEAKLIARAVVEERLAACANIVGGIQSVYQWEGRICEESEVALILKTIEKKKEPLVERVVELHSYEVPCVVCLPVVDGNPAFIDWVTAEVG